MPLYTFVTSYEGRTYVSQETRSNYHGHGDWLRDLPKDALSKQQKGELTAAQIYGGMEPIPNRVNAWTKSFMLSGSLLTVVAVQTAK